MPDDRLADEAPATITRPKLSGREGLREYPDFESRQLRSFEDLPAPTGRCRRDTCAKPGVVRETYESEESLLCEQYAPQSEAQAALVTQRTRHRAATAL